MCYAFFFFFRKENLIEYVYRENVHVDIALTTYPPQVDKRGHLANHLPTPFCPRGF